jgi:hypothetical protein
MTSFHSVSNYKKLVDAIALANHARTGKLIATCLKHGDSVGFMIEQLAEVMAGRYSPKQFDTSEIDFALLCWRYGGKRLMAAVCSKLGMPVESTVRLQLLLLKFEPCHRGTQDLALFKEAVIKNLVNLVSREGVMRPLILTFDEVAIEADPRADIGRNCVTNLCVQHSETRDLGLGSYDSMLLLVEAIEAGNTHTHMNKSISIHAYIFNTHAYT